MINFLSEYNCSKHLYLKYIYIKEKNVDKSSQMWVESEKAKSSSWQGEHVAENHRDPTCPHPRKVQQMI
jgi:hypothetical protein